MNPHGRPPKPTARKIAEGDRSKVGKRKLEQKLAAEPKASAGLGRCPKHLTPRARATWRLWAEELEVMKLNRRPDAPALEAACRAYDRAVKADLLLDKEGLLVKEQVIAEDGEVIVLKVKKHPAVEISSRAWMTVKAFVTEFGFTPASRTRLTIEKKDDGQDDLMKLLSQPRETHPTTTVN